MHMTVVASSGWSRRICYLLYLIWNEAMKRSFEQLLTYTLIGLAVGLLVPWSELAKKNTEETVAIPHEKGLGPNQNSPLSYPSVDSIRVLTTIDPAAFPFNGRFFSALAWHDQLGANIFILSEQGTYEDGNGRKEVFAYHYVKRDTSYAILWQLNDFVDGSGCDLAIQLIHFFPLLSDIDSNGIAETAIFYSLDNRCDAVPFPAKLIVHEGAEKFAIRGIRHQYLGPPEKVHNAYRAEVGLPPTKYKNLDTASTTLDSSIIRFYSHQWDEFISLENRLEGILADSLIRTMN